MKETGYVYILTNPSFKEDWVKIGKSSRPVDIRSKESDNTAVPLSFEIYATLKIIHTEQLSIYIWESPANVAQQQYSSMTFPFGGTNIFLCSNMYIITSSTKVLDFVTTFLPH